jgi:soluble lytic murein transglycosylase
MQKKLTAGRKNLLIMAGTLLLLLAACGVHQCKNFFMDFFIDDSRYDAEITAAANAHGLPAPLVKALIRQESKFNADAVGKHGEIGLMQLLPAGSAAEWARINHRPVPSRRQLADVHTNLNIGCWYLARAVKKWSGYRHGTELALAQYNAGEKNAIRWKPPTPDGEVIPRITWPGTRRYVSNIMQNYLRESVNQKKSALP